MHPFGVEWAAAIKPGFGQLEALLYLAQRPQELRGALCFEQPPGASNDWQALVPLTTPLCKCGRQRLLAPRVGRSRFVSDAMPRLVVLRDEDRLDVALEGGVLSGKLLQCHYWVGMLFYRSDSSVSAPNEPPRPFTARPTVVTGGATFAASHTALRNVIQRQGEVIVSWQVGGVILPAFSIVGAPKGKLEIELDAGMTALTADADTAHRCG